MSFSSRILCRPLSTTCARFQKPRQDEMNSKQRLNRLVLYNKRHLREHKKQIFKRFQRPSEHKGKDPLQVELCSFVWYFLFEKTDVSVTWFAVDFFLSFPAGIPIHTYGCRPTGVRHKGGWEGVPEMIPELVVPDIPEDFPLKPYVSYKAKEIEQEELTAKDIFNVVYGRKILRDFKEGSLDAEGNPSEPSAEEAMTPEEARKAARRTGSDLFTGGAPRSKIWNVRWRYSDTDMSDQRAS